MRASVEPVDSLAKTAVALSARTLTSGRTSAAAGDVPAVTPSDEDLRAIAKYTGIKPTRLARALNDPENLFTHITVKDMGRLASRFAFVITLWPRIYDAVQAYERHQETQRTKPE